MIEQKFIQVNFANSITNDDVNDVVLFLLFLLLTLNKQMLAGYGLTGALLDLRQFLGTEIPLNMMKNAFYFTLKSLFVLKIFKLLF